MLLGVKKLVAKITIGDEKGIYRQNDEGHQYLMFSCTTYKQATKLGTQIAKLMGIKFLNLLPVPEKPEIDEDDLVDAKDKTNEVISVTVTDAVGNYLPEENEPENNLQHALDGVNKFFDNQKPKGKKISDSQTQGWINVIHSNKPKKVSGVAKKVAALAAQGKSKDEAIAALLPEYLAAGRTEKEAKQLMSWYVKEVYGE